MTQRERFKEQAQHVLDHLDQVSKTRALWPDESRLLERCINIVDGRIEPQRMPHGATKVLLRSGFKRDMRIYRNKARDDHIPRTAVNPERDRLRQRGRA